MGLFGNKNTKTLAVEGMNCGHCVMSVTKALEGVNGVKKAKVNLAKHEAIVTLDNDDVKTEDMIKAVEEAGFKASVKQQ